MPEIDHKAPVSGTLADKAKAITTVLADPTISDDKLEAAVEAVLLKHQAERKEAAQPKEPNWAALTEQQAYANDVYIPTIDHELPDYMNIKLKDPEYEVVWASKDQRRLGQLLATGYEMLNKEHVHPSFKLPLIFDSEGMYTYIDVVAMRVHKRILYGKRRKALQVSLDQLCNRTRPPRVRVKDSYSLSEPFIPGAGQSLYSDIV